MTEYTPGPWRYVEKGDSESQHICVLVVDPQITTETLLSGCGFDPICEVNWAGDDAEQYANARLLAAAPDMLEALHAAIQFLGPISGSSPRGVVADHVRAAIAKAQAK